MGGLRNDVTIEADRSHTIKLKARQVAECQRYCQQMLRAKRQAKSAVRRMFCSPAVVKQVRAEGGV